MKAIFLKIENFLVIFSRIFWVIISLLSFVIAIFFLIFAFNKYFISESNPNLEIPVWNEVKRAIFPPELSSDQEINKNTTKTNLNNVNEEEYDEELNELLNSIYLNFTDYKELIRAELTMSSLKSFLNENLRDYKVEDNLPSKGEIITGLTNVFKDANRSSDLVKIGKYENRISLLNETINEYFIRLNYNYDIYKFEQNLVIAQNLENKTQSLVYFYIGASSIASFIFLVLFIIIFRVEHHIKRLTNAKD
ncbi:MAG: hypothetical protein ACJZ62_02640 [Candidatus Pelagibacterales bacterium]|mgnify:CR=1 FL=1